MLISCKKEEIEKVEMAPRIHQKIIPED